MRFGYFNKNGKQYQIIGQLTRSDRSQPLNLKSLTVRNNQGQLVQLDNVVKIEENSIPPQIFHFNRYVSATVQAQLAKGVSLGQGITEMEEVFKKSVKNENVTYALDGAARDFKESSSSLLFSLLIAVVLIYLILAAQFESFVSPMVIMFTVPLALFGALFSLWYFNQTVNIFSQIGMIMLVGLVTKNGILIVEFANQRLTAGLSVIDAVKESAAARLRPILMTSLATAMGILPVALALGAGAESRVSMGIAVLGGIIISTGLTLFIIPAIYAFMVKAPKNHVA